MTTAPTPASAPAGPPPARLSTRVDVAIQGIRLLDPSVSRRAGAGPSDDGHVLLGGVGAAIPLRPPLAVHGQRRQAAARRRRHRHGRRGRGQAALL